MNPDPVKVIDDRIAELTTRVSELMVVRAQLSPGSYSARSGATPATPATPSASPAPLPKAAAGNKPGQDKDDLSANVELVVSHLRANGPLSFAEIRKALSWHGQVASPAIKAAIEQGVIRKRTDGKYEATGN